MSINYNHNVSVGFANVVVTRGNYFYPPVLKKTKKNFPIKQELAQNLVMMLVRMRQVHDLELSLPNLVTWILTGARGLCLKPAWNNLLE